MKVVAKDSWCLVGSRDMQRSIKDIFVLLRDVIRNFLCGVHWGNIKLRLTRKVRYSSMFRFFIDNPNNFIKFFFFQIQSMCAQFAIHLLKLEDSWNLIWKCTNLQEKFFIVPSKVVQGKLSLVPRKRKNRNSYNLSFCTWEHIYKPHKMRQIAIDYYFCATFVLCILMQRYY
jgi:hypothetical protein